MPDHMPDRGFAKDYRALFIESPDIFRSSGLALTCSIFIILILCLSPVVHATNIEISGSVAAMGVDLVPLATLSCSERGATNVSLPTPIESSGRFSLLVEASAAASHITCTIEAPSFRPLTRTGIINNNRIDFGILRLKPFSNLSIEAVIPHHLVPNRSTGVSVLIKNLSLKEESVRELSLSATAHRTTSCFDPRPTLIFNFSSRLRLSLDQDKYEQMTSMDINSPAIQWKDRGAAKIRLETMGCDQARLILRITYPFDIPPSSSSWFRFELPEQLEVEDKRKVRVALYEWDQMIVEISLVNGTKIKQGS